MAQQKYSFDGFTPVRQPSEVKPMWATTSTSDSGRSQFGVMDNKVMFSNEAFKITFPRLYGDDMAGILRAVMGKRSFQFYHYSPYHGRWLSSSFMVANIDSSGIMVKDGREYIDGLTFQVTAINPI